SNDELVNVGQWTMREMGRFPYSDWVPHCMGGTAARYFCPTAERPGDCIRRLSNNRHMAYLPQIMKLQVKQKIASLACPSKRMLWKT
ncbi:hypothetical protein FocTR4_00008582, partial [Fusarium oxysporum f. sp. cubense]